LDYPDWFREEFGSGGEDRDFFRRKIKQGFVFIWCNVAIVFESIPPERWSIIVQIKRAVIRGRVAYAAKTIRAKSLIVSAFALVAYCTSLPLLLVSSPIIGYEIFVKTIISLSDHLGKILTWLRIDLVKEKYITTQSDTNNS
jgi:hypothetical protein